MAATDSLHAECGPCRVRRRTEPVERALALVVALGALGALVLIFGGGFVGRTLPATESLLAVLALLALSGALALALMVSLVEPWMLSRAKGTLGAGPAYRHATRCRRCGAAPTP